MFKDDLYTIQNITAENNSVDVVIQLNEKHEIFVGHFPEQPVLPGVCMMQMIKEILETFLNNKLQLIKAGEIKFLSLIQPSILPLEIFIKYDSAENTIINIIASITVNKIICCKMKAAYQVKN